MIGHFITAAYLAAFALGVTALWKSRGSRWMYALTFMSTFGALAFALMYMGYIRGAEYRLIEADFQWAAAHINSAAVLSGFHFWRLRRPV